MNIELKKQQEFKLLLKDAFEIKKEFDAILEQTAEVSKKISLIGDGIVNLSKNISEISKQFGKENDSIIKGAEILGSVIKFSANFWAKQKERKLKKAMLPKKQAIAQAKIEIIRKLRIRIIKEHTLLEQYVIEEAKKVSDLNNEKKYEILQKGLAELLDTYFIFKHLLSISDFFIAEFEAWLNNFHESKSVFVPATEIYKECVNKLIENSEFPTQDDFQKKISFGTVLLLSDEKTRNYAIQFQSITEYCDFISKKRIKSIFLFFTKKAKEFNHFYKKFLKSNDYIRYSTIFRFLTTFLLILLLFGGAIGFYFWFDNNYLSIVGFFIGLIVFLIFNRYMQKYLSKIKIFAKYSSEGYDKNKNKKIFRKFQQLKIRDFFLSIMIDTVGMLSYLFPGAGEAIDAIWAPISGILIFFIYKGRIGVGIVGALFATAEEAIPGTDFIPTGLIMWTEKYFISKNKTLEKMGYAKK